MTLVWHHMSQRQIQALQHTGFVTSGKTRLSRWQFTQLSEKTAVLSSQSRAWGAVTIVTGVSTSSYSPQTPLVYFHTPLFLFLLLFSWPRTLLTPHLHTGLRKLMRVFLQCNLCLTSHIRNLVAKTHLFILLIYLQFDQGLAEMTILCPMEPSRETSHPGGSHTWQENYHQFETRTSI